MPLFDHLGELRRRLTIVVVAVLVAAVIVYFATPTLIDIMIDPIRSAMPEGTELTILSALGGFTIRFKVAFFFGVIICTPIIIWEAMGFFLPALHDNERKWVVPTVGAMVALFFIGMIFCYFVIQKAAFGWLLGQTTEWANLVALYQAFEGNLHPSFENKGVYYQLNVPRITCTSTRSHLPSRAWSSSPRTDAPPSSGLARTTSSARSRAPRT